MKSRTTEPDVPAEAATDQDPAIAAQIAQLREQWDRNGRSERVGRVAGGDPRYRYYWIATVSSIGDRRPISQAVLDAERDVLRRRFYEPVPPGGPEHVVGCPHAELWRCHVEVWQERRRLERDYWYRSQDTVAQLWRSAQMSRQRPAGRGYLPADVISAMPRR